MMRLRSWFLLLPALAALSLPAPRAGAAELAGVAVPDVQTLNGQTLVLNGAGLRTYSVFNVRIYVAALYLPRRGSDAEAILDAAAPKILLFRFLHDVSLEKEQKAWRDGLAENCVDPCRLNQAEVEAFLASLRPISAGDNFLLVFQPDGMAAYENGQPLGRVNDPQFARVVLAMFIGPHARNEDLRRGLLGQGQNGG
jgi:hypothetical protein